MEKENNTKDWFETWFDSPYYHILYKDRDHTEAKNFITKLFQFLKPNPTDKLVDIACGQGRHAITMNELGFNLDAFDLAKHSIEEAQKSANKRLHFYVNDIRNPLKVNAYDFAFNLFTSFGYFSLEDDNFKSINAIAKSLKDNGVFVMDFLNAHKVIANLNHQETKTVSGITFNLKRELKGGFIIKHINFSDNGKEYYFTENVKAINLSDFKKYFSAAGLTISATFGDYNLSDFNELTSDRLIMVAKK